MTLALILIINITGLVLLGILAHWWISSRQPPHVDSSGTSPPGFSVEVDCQACGQFNRVPGARLRDRPKCGHCKARLMPGRRVTLCRSFPMQDILGTALDAVWTDADRFWVCLADHVSRETRALAQEQERPRTEAQG